MTSSFQPFQPNFSAFLPFCMTCEGNGIDFHEFKNLLRMLQVGQVDAGDGDIKVESTMRGCDAEYRYWVFCVSEDLVLEFP